MDNVSFAMPKALKPTKKNDTKSETEPKKEENIVQPDTKTADSDKNKTEPRENTQDNATINTSEEKKELKAPIAPVPKAPEQGKERKEPEQAVLQYKEPKWSGPASFPYTLEVLKGGKILEEVDISENCYVTVGRLPSCDVPCLHPSISRYHAVFQHRSAEGEKPGAVFLYDLGSSYGTTVNKVKITPRTYYMMKTGYVIKFGASTRLYIVKGPPEEAFDDEEEMVPEPAVIEDSSVESKINKLGILASEEAEIMLNMLKAREKDVDPSTEPESGGVNWGFREDAPDEDEGELKLDLTKMSRPADFKDPKKTLRGFFEREGVELEYVVTESGVGKNHQYKCRVELPIDTASPVYAEGTTSGKKKDAVLACALHGCRLLDAYGVLRSSRRNEDIESRKQKLEKNDFYDSDEDTFLDRTGEVEHKRKRRMLRAGVQDSSQKSRSHEMLSQELRQVNEEIDKIQKTISENKQSQEEGEEEDALDAYMSSVSETTVTTGALKEMKKKLHDLKQSRVKLERLCEMSKPIALPEVKRLSAVPSNITTGKVGKVSVSKLKSSSGTGEAKSLQPSKKIKIELSLKPKHDDTGVKSETEITKKSHSDSPVKMETDSTEKVSEITEFSSEKAVEILQLSSEKVTEISEFSSDSAPLSEESSTSKTHLPSKQEDDKSSSKPSNPPPKSPSEPKKGARKRGKKPAAPQNATLSENVQWDDDLHDENFVNWTPPVGQSGDGRTKLNEKFGY